jgi:hypothetical protein
VGCNQSHVRGWDAADRSSEIVVCRFPVKLLSGAFGPSVSDLLNRTASILAHSTSNSKSADGRFTIHGLLSIGNQLTRGAQGFITFVMAGRLLPQKEFGFVPRQLREAGYRRSAIY